ncbi:SMP-30/gluconolactonase/LRE family protein [Streptomyces sp. QL37]|uniref:SMP-30/gluconolactonase/LRE family protein n=1 Tax=Streptomyces sp. QL37 TaxID=2093747 RepID=UPI000CF2023D|nr:SMP-30/gluconolactonase/LRE family protein [Streptomyces sp. QL37]PPQ56433.1 gluconolaconase [Streptomyces sp. QL37]
MTDLMPLGVPDRLDLGEGIRWADGRLVCVDILTGRLLTPEGDGTAPLRTVTRLDGPLGAVAPVAGRPGTWVAAAGTGVCLLTPGEDPVWLAEPERDAPTAMRMNDGCVDPHGRFWAGSMAYDGTPDAGALYRTDSGGSVTRILAGITIPNGPAFDRDGTTMYLADSARGVVRRYPVAPRDGSLGEGEAFIEVTDGSPDGMTVDTEGALWTAVWGAGEVRRYLPDGTLGTVLHLPVSQPAGVCLGGGDGRTLYVTTARLGLAAPSPLDGAVFSARVRVPGLPTAAYRRAAG